MAGRGGSRGNAGVLRGTPVTKLWLVVMLVAYIFQAAAVYRPVRRLLKPLVFKDSIKELTALTLVYHFRTLEQFLGSRKYAANLAAITLVSQTILAAVAPWHAAHRLFGSGLLCVMFGCLLQFWMHVPSLMHVRVGRWVQIGDRWSVFSMGGYHLLALQQTRHVLVATVVCAAAGVCAGLAVENNVGGLKRWRLPQWASRLLVGEGRRARRGGGAGDDARISAMRRAMAAADAEADAEAVEHLLGMFPGVERSQVLQALQLSGNDAHRAASVLLDSFAAA
ncbi:hypothetical protein GGI07_005686 [Coemansia sp. Benny D115]|nr:hypothetical protein GGI07_005686 [Coemansia sp. Benny D115]